MGLYLPKIPWLLGLPPNLVLPYAIRVANFLNILILHLRFLELYVINNQAISNIFRRLDYYDNFEFWVILTLPENRLIETKLFQQHLTLSGGRGGGRITKADFFNGKRTDFKTGMTKLYPGWHFGLNLLPNIKLSDLTWGYWHWLPAQQTDPFCQQAV